jgi:WD40 repeat protein
MAKPPSVKPETRLSKLGRSAAALIAAAEAELKRPAREISYRWNIGGHPRAIYDLALHPTRPWLVTASRDRTLRLWCRETLTCLQVYRGHTANVTRLSLHAEGELMVSASRDGTARLWNLVSGKCVRTFLHDGVPIECVHAGQSHLAAGNAKGRLLVWGYDGRLLAQIDAHEGKTIGVCLGPGGGQACSAGADGSIRRWDISSGVQVWSRRGHEGGVTTLCAAPDGSTLFTGGEDTAVVCWNPESGEKVRTYDGHNEKIVSLSLSTDGGTLTSVSRDGTVRLWDPETGLLRHLHCYMSSDNRTSYLPDEDLYLVGHRGVIYAFELETARFSRSYGDCERGIWALSKPSPQQAVLLSAYGDGKIRVWNTQTAECLRTLGLDFTPNSMAIHEGKGMVALVNMTGAIAHLWDYRRGRKLGEFRHGAGLSIDGMQINEAAFSRDGTYLIVACRGGAENIWVWDIATRRRVTTLEGHEDSVLSVAEARAADRLASAGADGVVRVFDTSREPVQWSCVFKSERHDRWYNRVAISDDGSRVAATSADGRVEIWNVDSGARLSAPPKAETTFRDLFFSPDGKRLFAGGGDVRFLVWSLERNVSVRAWKGEPSRSPGYYDAAAFNPDSKLLLLSSNFYIARIGLNDFAPEKQLERQTRNVTHLAMQGERCLLIGTSLIGSKVVDLVSGRIAREIRVPSAPQGCSASVSGRLALASNEQFPHVFAARGTSPRGGYTGHTAEVIRVCFSADGESLFTASADGDVRRFSYEHRNCRAHYRGNGKALSALALIRRDRAVVAGGEDGTIHCWNTRMPWLVQTYRGHEGAVTALAPLAGGDGRGFVSAGADGTLRLWRTDRDGPLLTLPAHRDQVRGLASSWDGAWVLSGSDDWTARLWRLQPGGGLECEWVIEGHAGKVTSALIAPRIDLLITGGWDGTVRFWSRERKCQLAAYHVIDRGFLWTTPADEHAPNGWLHTDRTDLVDVIAHTPGVGPRVVREADLRDQAIRPYLSEDMVMNRLNDFPRYEGDLAARLVAREGKALLSNRQPDPDLPKLERYNE